MSVPAQLLHLIEVFGRNAEAYHRGALNETETRVQFIDPFFDLLGWDMHNARGYADAFKDVVHEVLDCKRQETVLGTRHLMFLRPQWRKSGHAPISSAPCRALKAQPLMCISPQG